MRSAAGAPIVLLLAAGQGTRLKSRTIKLLHPVAGQPMVTWVARAARAIAPSRVVAVVGYQADRVKDALAELCDAFVLQAEQRGTGHAVLTAEREAAKGAGTIVILNGDLPNLDAATLRALLALHRRAKAALSLVTTEVPDSTGYGRILRDGKGRVLRIVEHKDASAAERSVREINCGIYCADAAKIFRALKRLRPDNAQGEYYLTDTVRLLLESGRRASVRCAPDYRMLLGINTPEQLAEAEAAWLAMRRGSPR